MPRERIALQFVVIRAIVLQDSPCWWGTGECSQFVTIAVACSSVGALDSIE